MGIRDLFETTMKCPKCHRAGARKSLLGGVRCANPECPNHDTSLAQAAPRRGAAAAKTASAPRRAASAAFRPGPERITIRYRNHREEDKTFEGDPTTIRLVNEHVSLRVAPEWPRIALHKDSIANMGDVLAAAAKVPSAVERKILTYHTRRGSRSPRYDEVRRKYPDWPAG